MKNRRHSLIRPLGRLHSWRLLVGRSEQGVTMLDALAAMSVTMIGALAFIGLSSFIRASGALNTRYALLGSIRNSFYSYLSNNEIFLDTFNDSINQASVGSAGAGLACFLNASYNFTSCTNSNLNGGNPIPMRVLSSPTAVYFDPFASSSHFGFTDSGQVCPQSSAHYPYSPNETCTIIPSVTWSNLYVNGSGGAGTSDASSLIQVSVSFAIYNPSVNGSAMTVPRYGFSLIRFVPSCPGC